jgi:hypothetical protein
MAYFVRFLGWFILYSLLYFVYLDILGVTPGKDNPILGGILLILSIPLWRKTWKDFDSAFGPHAPQSANGATAYSFALRNTGLMYYLMVLKLFLLAMGANGVITLSQHTGGARTFYIWNFIVLYIYAIPFFIIKFIALRKGLGARIVVDAKRISLQAGGATAAEIGFDAIDAIAVEEATGGMLIESAGVNLFVAGPVTKGSSFYTAGAESILETLKKTAAGKIKTVASLKEEMKQKGFKPAI